jgi:hypothetical protein
LADYANDWRATAVIAQWRLHGVKDERT